ncbi:uncharacterized protein EKO05_0005998 [Ascochyta rabiei]|uniref:HECT-type E3 ubiquitin transferase n=1 Tax=Didymella rabiei TaxID=5454 RepID=A0A163M8Z4_DIDRA|nr:uncharacterized protein EKO05_0005998 [Ascochyta rabiei]KZM28505.1 ligase [Ascochyta rabiei]UPX15554.1 hypothetical protein EKO05_0005998 [Ascochyta rabiei]
MTTSEGGPRCPRDEPKASSSSSTTPSDAPSEPRRRSSQLLEHRLGNVVDVQDPSRLIECSHLERQRQFQYLVRHYLAQILYGCKSAYCDTPTCLSCNKRGICKPYRPPTQLTARALAHYLASQSNPHRGLCPHELKVSPSTLGIEGAVDFSIGYGDRDDKDYAQHAQSTGRRRSVARAIDGRHQTRKDIKSIGQNLYDSFSLIYSYSKQIPGALWAFDALRAQSYVTHQGKRAGSPNDKPVTAHTYETASIVRQRSQQNLRAQSQAHAARTHSEVLSNGQQVHRVPYYRLSTPDQAHTTKNATSAPTDCTVDLPRMSISKTGRKSFTLGGSIVPPLAKAETRTPPMPAHQKATKPKHNVYVAPATSRLNCDLLDQLKDEVHYGQQQRGSAFLPAVGYDTARLQPARAFVNRSLFYTLSDAETLLQSFRDTNEAFQHSPLPHLDSDRLAHCFRDWDQRNGALIFDSLAIAVEALFTLPPELETQKSTSSKLSSNNNSTKDSTDKSESAAGSRYLSNYEAAHIVIICIHALTSSVPVGWPRSWAQLRSLRSWGVVVPSTTGNTDDSIDPYVNIIDALEYEPAVRLADRLLRGIGARTCFEHILSAMHKDPTSTAIEPINLEDTLTTILVQHLEVAEQVALNTKQKMKTASMLDKEPGWTVTATFIEWLKTMIIKRWNGNVEVNKWSSAGTAVMLLHEFYDKQRRLNIWSKMFRIPYLNEHLNKINDPVKFLDWKPQPNLLHILQYPELHPTDYLVRFFRTINLTSMVAQYDHTQHVQQMLRTLDVVLREPYLYMIKHRLKVTLNDYLVLDVSREEPLKDTLDQLWRQERKMLLKPLKVKLGQHEGEVGLDHGGVTYEFFRVVLGEAFAPDYGMFTIDPQTSVTWFQPGSLEPLWKFKMLGVLFSLAIYNGITLPVTFPLVFYNLMLNSRFKFLDDHTSIDYIRDGWPDLAKSFDTLLQWNDDNVADIFMRDYVFSYEVFGHKVDIDMTERKDNTSLPSETALVTNENRGAFVRDYVMHLILHSVRPQLRAFKKGFYTCLNPRGLELFTPRTLKKLVEGTQIISISDLRACATYEDYDAMHPTVRAFWDIVQGYTQEDASHLLEFVTASDRVPVTGYKSLTFNIVRMGGDSEQLPTSSTCFGKLYLPEYRDKDKMMKKLELAIQNAKGFGVV